MEFWSVGYSSLDLIIRWTWSHRNFWNWSINQISFCITEGCHWWLPKLGSRWVRCFDRIRSFISLTLLGTHIERWWKLRSASNISSLISKDLCLRSLTLESLSYIKWNFDTCFITNCLLTNLCSIAWWTWCNWSKREVLLFCSESIIWWILFSRVRSNVGHFLMRIINIWSWWTFILTQIKESPCISDCSMSATNWFSFWVFCWSWTYIERNLGINKSVFSLIWWQDKFSWLHNWGLSKGSQIWLGHSWCSSSRIWCIWSSGNSVAQ